MVVLAHFEKERKLKGREGFGFLSPSLSAFEKMKCIFSIAPMESLEKSPEF